jgi:hypothetical protein
MNMMATSTKPKSSRSQQIVDRELYQALIAENQALREQLVNVSSLGITAMFQTHRSDAERFDKTILKGVAEIMQHIEVSELKKLYEQGYQMAAAPSVIEKFKHPHLKTKG